MKISELSIRRPVFATVMSLAIILFGIVAYTRLPVREYPNIDSPIVSVNTFYRGASAGVMETEITDVLEEQLATIEGIRTMTSASSEQGSRITIEFELGRNIEEAANDVRDKVSRTLGRLPDEADEPVVSKVDANAQPIIWIALSSERHNTLELSEVADRVMKERLLRFPGVGAVIIGGERRYSMRVWLDPQKMAAHGLTTVDVETAIQRANAEIPGGRVEGKGREFSVLTRGEVSQPEEFAAIIVRQNGIEQVRLGDVAQVEVGAEDDRAATRYNGKPAVGLGVVKQSTASTLDVGEEVERAMPELQKLLPEGMEVHFAYNSSLFVRQSINEVGETILIALCLVILVILAFLNSMRATIIPAVAIPISIVGALAVVYFLGFTINILTLLAIVLAIGLVVDDAIVMLENIYRHLQMGKSRMRAAYDGAKEIGFAVLATTIALVAVFVPLAFLTGSVGRLFNEFGITVAAAVLISGFVALTFTPMMCSRVLRPLHGSSTSWASRSFDAFFEFVDRTYDRILRFCMRNRWATIVGSILFVAFGLVVFRFIPSELIPTEDRGTAFGIIMAPDGSTLEYTDKYMRQMEGILMQLPEYQGLFSATGQSFGAAGSPSDGFLFLRLKDRSERDKSQQQIVSEMFSPIFSIPGVTAFLINLPSLNTGAGNTPIEYVLLGDTYDELQQAVSTVMRKASQLGFLINLNTDLKLNKPQLEIHIDRDRAAQLGVSVADIGATLETFLGGRVVSNFKRGSKQYDVIMQLRPQDRATPNSVDQLYLRGNGDLIQLATVVNINEAVAPKSLNHFNRVRSAKITANLAPGVAMGDALAALDNIANTELDKSIKRDLAGQSREFRDSSASLYFMFGLAVLFIFLVLAAQFESFVHPITILLSVPLAMVGALVALFVFGQTMNIFSQIGLIMLIGLVTKNSILIVEFSNQLREQGKEALEAVVEASRIRLRPILMTSFATVFGVLPIAIGLGAGAESRRPLGIAVVGGLIFSTFLTLVLVPVVYALLARFTKAAKHHEETSVEHVAERPAGV
ncbi:MAG: efflux RND transporter permease subunit [Candidatus Zixiibacteriota bacterium]